jgi:ferrous iron transport protein A
VTVNFKKFRQPYFGLFSWVVKRSAHAGSLATRYVCHDVVLAVPEGHPYGEEKGIIWMRTLRDVLKGETVSVVKLHGEGAIKRRIMDMGITRGTEIFVRKVAPLGDPVEVRVRGYELSIRKEDAETIEVSEAAQDESGTGNGANHGR